MPDPAARLPPATPRAYRTIVLFFRRLMRVFFRRVEVTGLAQVPTTGGGIVVSWHPNGLIDPGLIFTNFPRRIVFGARHGLFKLPIFGWLMRRIGTVPIYRRTDPRPGVDESARRAANSQSLDALARAVAEGSFSALFPEGLSHDAPFLMELKTGVARLYYRARQLAPSGAPAPVILPVGLHYDKKGVFGSNALVAYHPPLELSPDLREPLPEDAPPESRRARYAALTSEIERELRAAVYPTESWELHQLMHRARKLVRAERAQRAGAALGRPEMSERILGFARLWSGYYARLKTHPEETRETFDRVRRYDQDLSSLEIEDHELDSGQRLASLWLPGLLVLQAILVYLLLPPILVIGYLVNAPTALGLLLLSKLTAKARKDEASFKVLVGAVAFPLTWLAVGLLVAWGETALRSAYPRIPDAPLLTGLVAVVLSALGGAVALRYQRLARETARALRVRITRTRRARTIRRLRAERGRIFDRIMVLAENLELPGAVAPDGRVIAAADGETSSAGVADAGG